MLQAPIGATGPQRGSDAIFEGPMPLEISWPTSGPPPCRRWRTRSHPRRSVRVLPPSGTEGPCRLFVPWKCCPAGERLEHTPVPGCALPHLARGAPACEAIRSAFGNMAELPGFASTQVLGLRGSTAAGIGPDILREGRARHILRKGMTDDEGADHEGNDNVYPAERVVRRRHGVAGPRPGRQSSCHIPLAPRSHDANRAAGWARPGRDALSFDRPGLQEDVRSGMMFTADGVPALRQDELCRQVSQRNRSVIVQ